MKAFVIDIDGVLRRNLTEAGMTQKEAIEFENTLTATLAKTAKNNSLQRTNEKTS